MKTRTIPAPKTASGYYVRWNDADCDNSEHLDYFPTLTAARQHARHVLRIGAMSATILRPLEYIRPKGA